ncbi:MAG: CooT family nickel-binding protein [Nitrososphaerales archaeon]
MCELKVSLKEDGKSVEVAQDVIYVKLSEQNLILRDVLGSSKIVEGALVEELDISKESLILLKSPLLTKVARFLSILNASISTRRYDQSIEAAWEDVKAEGDRCVREAWKMGRKG